MRFVCSLKKIAVNVPQQSFRFMNHGLGGRKMNLVGNEAFRNSKRRNTFLAREPVHKTPRATNMDVSLLPTSRVTSRWLPLCPQPLLLHLQDNYDLGILLEEDTLLHKPCILTGSPQRRGSATGPTPPASGGKRCWLDHFSDKIIAPPILGRKDARARQP